jgi:hypothetical protein
MKRIQVTPNFYLDEFIDPTTYAARGEKSIALMDHRMIIFAQWLRETLGKPITINNWATGGQYRESGLRVFNTTTGAKWSQHKFGRAVDIKCAAATPKQLFSVIKAHEDYLIKRQICTTIENIDLTPKWLHCDCRFTGLDKILIVNP